TRPNQPTAPSGASSGVLPLRPTLDITTRFATQDDFPFIDALQKAESDGLGFQYEQALRKRIDQHNILIADALGSDNRRISAGYCLGVDRYQKRSELGIIYQIGVLPDFRRSLVAATLLQARFATSAYGTKLYCCWCKQSLAANRFWEAMGFVPLAFRAAGRSTIDRIQKKTGSTSGAVHIFWQKRIREGDTETAYWYPYETQGGAMMEGRVVLPLPPEVQWHEATPVVLPGAEQRAAATRQLEHKVDALTAEVKAAKKHRTRKPEPTPPKPTRAIQSYGFGTGFGEPAKPVEPAQADTTLPAKQAAEAEAEVARLEAEQAAAKAELKAAQRKNDPELVAYARELRDRWQEHITDQPHLLEHKHQPHYHVSRSLNAPAPTSQPHIEPQPTRLLDAA
ncbi:MAG: hypothetical protein AAF797_13690, partial [Planctomycetota bacterium]